MGLKWDTFLFFIGCKSETPLDPNSPIALRRAEAIEEQHQIDQEKLKQAEREAKAMRLRNAKSAERAARAARNAAARGKKKKSPNANKPKNAEQLPQRPVNPPKRKGNPNAGKPPDPNPKVCPPAGAQPLSGQRCMIIPRTNLPLPPEIMPVPIEPAGGAPPAPQMFIDPNTGLPAGPQGVKTTYYPLSTMQTARQNGFMGTSGFTQGLKSKRHAVDPYGGAGIPNAVMNSESRKYLNFVNKRKFPDPIGVRSALRPLTASPENPNIGSPWPNMHPMLMPYFSTFSGLQNNGHLKAQSQFKNGQSMFWNFILNSSGTTQGITVEQKNRFNHLVTAYANNIGGRAVVGNGPLTEYQKKLLAVSLIEANQHIFLPLIIHGKTSVSWPNKGQNRYQNMNTPYGANYGSIGENAAGIPHPATGKPGWVVPWDSDGLEKYGITNAQVSLMNGGRYNQNLPPWNDGNQILNRRNPDGSHIGVIRVDTQRFGGEEGSRFINHKGLIGEKNGVSPSGVPFSFNTARIWRYNPTGNGGNSVVHGRNGKPPKHWVDLNNYVDPAPNPLRLPGLN
jgi:hypothetical protein